MISTDAGFALKISRNLTWFIDIVEDGNADPMPWSRVARRRTDLVPTIPAPRDGGSRGSSAPRPPGRAYSMSRLDQLAQPRRPRPLVPPPPPPSSQPLPPTRPPRHRSMGNLAAAASHRSVGNLAIASSMGPSPPPRKHLKPSTPQAGKFAYIIFTKIIYIHIFILTKIDIE